jgi:hypothetical protein
MDKPSLDAALINDTLGIISTHDERLIARTLRLHFDGDERHLGRVRRAYCKMYGREVEDGIRRGVRKGGYRDLVCVLVGGAV